METLLETIRENKLTTIFLVFVATAIFVVAVEVLADIFRKK
jgi:hypothetical protein